MGLPIEGQVGPRTVSDGATTELRQGRTGELITNDAVGRYHEPSSRTLVFGGSTTLVGVSIAAGMVSPVAAAATPLFGVYNPIGSGVLLSIIRAFVQSVSGTPGAGAFAYNVMTGQNISTGTAGQSSNGVSTGKGRFFNGAVAMTGGTQALLPYRPVGGPGSFAAALAASAGPLAYMDEVAGEIVLREGGLFVIAAPAAGTTWVVAAGASWIEVNTIAA